MNIISRSAHIVQQDFSDSIQSSLSNYINSKSNQSWNRFPSTYHQNNVHGGLNREVSHFRLEFRPNTGWVGENSIFQANRLAII